MRSFQHPVPVEHHFLAPAAADDAGAELPGQFPGGSFPGGVEAAVVDQVSSSSPLRVARNSTA